MNWKMEAEDKLRKYELMRMSLRNIPEEIDRLEVSASSIRGASTDKTPVKGGGSRQEEFLLNNLVLRQELKRSLRQARQWVRIVSEALAAALALPDCCRQRMKLISNCGAVKNPPSPQEAEDTNKAS